MNWPLKCYFRTLKRSILVTLGADKIPSREVPKWRKEVFQTFRKLTQIVPEINYVYTELGLSESNIKGSVRDLTEGLSESQKVKLARYITKKLTIKQRNYVPHELKQSSFDDINLDRLKQVFSSTNIYEIRGDLDGFLILAQMAQEDNPTMLEMADPETGAEGVEKLGDHLIQLFEQELRQRRF